jgi:cell division protein FtsB
MLTFSIAMSVLVGVWSYNCVSPKYHQWRSLSVKIDGLNQKLKDIKVATVEVRDNITRFNTDRDFVEEQARRARMVTDNDLVFVFD